MRMPHRLFMKSEKSFLTIMNWEQPVEGAKPLGIGHKFRKL